MKHASLALLLLACNGACLELEPSDRFPSEPVWHYELQGTWCDVRPTYSLCFTAESLYYSNHTYTWQASDCFERGTLSGALEFSPTTSPETQCFGNQSSLYSAQVDWTPYGLRMLIDGESHIFELEFQR